LDVAFLRICNSSVQYTPVVKLLLTILYGSIVQSFLLNNQYLHLSTPTSGSRALWVTIHCQSFLEQFPCSNSEHFVLRCSMTSLIQKILISSITTSCCSGLSQFCVLSALAIICVVPKNLGTHSALIVTRYAVNNILYVQFSS
jgi:hypothetical protein